MILGYRCYLTSVVEEINNHPRRWGYLTLPQLSSVAPRRPTPCYYYPSASPGTVARGDLTRRLLGGAGAGSARVGAPTQRAPTIPYVLVKLRRRIHVAIIL